MQDHGLLIVGTQRSGTTLLNRMLNAHPDVALLYQQSNFLRLDLGAYDLRRADEARRLLADARRVCSEFSDRFDDDAHAALLAWIDTAGPPALGALYRMVVRRLGGRGTRYWGEKYAGRAIEALKFLDAVPDGKVVHIVRDPRDVCASEKRKRMIEAGLPPVDPSFLSMAYDAKVAERVGAHLQNVASGNYHRLRYEDLVADPAGAARTLCAFLGLRCVPAMLQTGAFTDDDGRPWRANSSFERDVTSIRASFRGRWRSGLTRAEARCVERLCGPAMRRLGYRPPWRVSAWAAARLPPRFVPESWQREAAEVEWLATAAEEAALWSVTHPAYRSYAGQRLGIPLDFSRIDRIYREDDGRSPAGLPPPGGAGRRPVAAGRPVILTAMAVAAGADRALDVSWRARRRSAGSDLVRVVAPAGQTVAFCYASSTPRPGGRGRREGRVRLTLPAALQAGRYRVALHRGGGYLPVAEVPFVFDRADLLVEPERCPPGGAVRVRWSGVEAPAGTDMIGLVDPDGGIIAYAYTNGCSMPGGVGAKAGRIDMALPESLRPGRYRVLLCQHSGHALLAEAELRVEPALAGTEGGCDEAGVAADA